MSLIPFESIPTNESQEPLIDLSEYDFILEPVYFNQGLSDNSKIYLRKSVADKLQKIQKQLKIYKFKIWDGFRSRKVQDAIYNKYWNELKEKNPEWNEQKLKTEVGKFVTDAKNMNRIPPHSTGGAVDLTLVDESGKELNMGTSFDYFGPEASSFYFESNNLNIEAKENQKILRNALMFEDFCIDKDEWWHFDFGTQKWAFELDRLEAIYGEAEISN